MIGPIRSRRFGLKPAALLAVLAISSTFASVGPAHAQSFGTDRNYCDRSAVAQITSTSRSNLIGSAAGAALGGLLGSKMGKGGGSTALTVLGVVGGALAGGYVGRSMDPADQACVGTSLEHTPSNQSVAWQNPDNGSSYWVTPTGNYQGQNGEPCRRYVTQAVVNGQQQRSDGAACRDPNGAWVPVSLNNGSLPPSRAQGQGQGQGAVSSDTILQVQQKLHDLGFYVQSNIDGRWGPKTMSAVQNFQRTKGLNASGQLDIQTLNALGVSSQTAQDPSGMSAPPSQ
jgi:surface antigen